MKFNTPAVRDTNAQPAPIPQPETKPQKTVAPKPESRQERPFEVINGGAMSAEEQAPQQVETRTLKGGVFSLPDDEQLSARIIQPVTIAKAALNGIDGAAHAAMLQRRKDRKAAEAKLPDTYATPERMGFSRLTIEALDEIGIEWRAAYKYHAGLVQACRDAITGVGLLAYIRRDRIGIEGMRQLYGICDIARLKMEAQDRAIGFAADIFNESFRRITGCAGVKERAEKSYPSVQAGTVWTYEVYATELLQALEHAWHAVDYKSNVMVLRNVLLHHDGNNTLTVTGYDHRLCVSVDIDCTVTSGEPFDITVDAGTLKKSLKGKKGLIELSTEWDRYDDCYIAMCGAKIPTIFADDFPPLPNVTPTAMETINKAELHRAIERTVLATNPDDPRAFMGGALFSHEAIVATDGHRLVAIESNGFRLPEGFNAIIPTRTLNAVAKIIKGKGKYGLDGSADIALCSTDAMRGNAVLFTSGNVRIISRTIDVDYPNWERVKPEGSQGLTMTLNTEWFARLVAEAAEYAKDKENKFVVRLDISNMDNTVTVSAGTQDGGKYENSMPCDLRGYCDNFDGNTLTVHFNARYLLDMLKHKNETTYFELFGSMKGSAAGIWHDDANMHETHVLMPIKM